MVESTRLVLRLPPRLAEKIEQGAEDADMLPTEYVREVLRAALQPTSAAEGKPG